MEVKVDVGDASWGCPGRPIPAVLPPRGSNASPQDIKAPIKNIRLCRWGVIRVIKARREYQGFIKVTRAVIIKLLF